MGAAVSITRLDLTASELRKAASGEKDSAAARRILALALVLDGVDRKPIEIWFQDEARIGQQGTLTRVWAKRGTRPRAPHDQRYDWAYLFGAACPQRRVAAGLVMPAANAETMSLHLTAIGHKVAAGSHAALVLDGAGYHIAAALTIPENVTLVRLPPYAPELNPIENVWEYLRGNKLAITVFDGYDDIVDKTCDAWNFFEQDPKRIASITTRTWATVNN